MKRHLAIDIGASSGRHILGWLENGKMLLKEVYRFDNSQIRKNGHDCWDLQALARHVLAGIKAAGEEIAGLPCDGLTVGIDTWGVDYVLVDGRGLPCSDAVAYRDARTEGVPEELEKTFPFAELYAKTGIQKAVFNTIYQLVALKKESPEQLEKAERILLIPDYLNFVLTGRMANDYTDASTTSLLNAETKNWDDDILARLGLPRRIFPELTMPGASLGPLTSAVSSAVGVQAEVILPACHDTGSAYLAVPARDDGAIYLSSGTWSIIGVENPSPITTPEARAANFSNEGGAWGRFRFLKNIMGLWMIQSVKRELNGEDYVAGKDQEAKIRAVARLADAKRPDGSKWSYADLEAAARAAGGFASVVDAADKRFFAPDSMIEAVRSACEESGQPVPGTVGELVQCVYASLAGCYAREAKLLASLTGRTYTSLNIVGGGSKDRYLNELTAKATGLDVFAGPTEGTAIGNLIVQAIASGEFKTLAEARACVASSFDIVRVGCN